MPESQSWTWVRDTTTGHLYDVQTSRLPLDGVQVIANKPEHVGPNPRRPKHYVPEKGVSRTTDRTDQPAAAPAAGSDAAPAATTTKEQ